ncbi:Dihydrofolate reductase [hydrothermal vent metagenome]|uniref:dihydrofolate reductase n=1 Tax=hydrothermal vent metagenome TaxID=652676 RepID=A0A3B0TFS5_9ZZZZ
MSAPGPGQSAGLELVLVVARADNGVIGSNGGLPWRVRSDMAHFKRLTMAKPLLMGRKTWESLKGPLPGRTNIVVSKKPGYQAKGGHVADTIEKALVMAQDLGATSGAAQICVIGGAEIYRATRPVAHRIELTEIHMDARGDTVLEPFSPADWREVRRTAHAAAPGESADYSFVTLMRRLNPAGT